MSWPWPIASWINCLTQVRGWVFPRMPKPYWLPIPGRAIFASSRPFIGKCALLTDADMIQPDDLPAHMKTKQFASPHKPRTLEDMEKEYIINVLGRTEGNQTKASQILGINRKTLYKKIHRYKIFS